MASLGWPFIFRIIMSRFYTEFTIDCPALVYGKVLSLLFNRIHGTLSTYDLKEIGFSFPEWVGGEDSADTLGKRILLVSEDKAQLSTLLGQINIDDLEMQELVFATAVKPVPVNAEERVFSRDRQYEKQYKRKEQVAHKNPFVVIQSRSNKQKFTLRVGCRKVTEQQAGAFNSYGLSADKSVPVF